ncbi:hypothetical protein M8697_002501 [Providencia rettgeri]|nr:hypothetical protein [Providencia rettgeri]
MSIFSKIKEVENKHNIKIHEGENFKQALYNGHISDTDDYIIDKIELATKHYPNLDLALSTYESDNSSPRQFCYTIVIPIE